MSNIYVYFCNDICFKDILLSKKYKQVKKVGNYERLFCLLFKRIFLKTWSPHLIVIKNVLKRQNGLMTGTLNGRLKVNQKSLRLQIVQ